MSLREKGLNGRLSQLLRAQRRTPFKPLSDIVSAYAIKQTKSEQTLFFGSFMVVYELWSVFRRILRRNSIYRRNQKLYGTNFKYVVVNVNKRTALRSFRTLKHAREYLLEIQSFYERKNRVVYVNEHSRSIVVSSVAQYIFCDKKRSR